MLVLKRRAQVTVSHLKSELCDSVLRMAAHTTRSACAAHWKHRNTARSSELTLLNEGKSVSTSITWYKYTLASNNLLPNHRKCPSSQLSAPYLCFPSATCERDLQVLHRWGSTVDLRLQRDSKCFLWRPGLFHSNHIRQQKKRMKYKARNKASMVNHSGAFVSSDLHTSPIGTSERLDEGLHPV